MTTDLLVSIAVQFPLIVLFIWYSDRKDKQFQAFLNEQRKEYIGALEKLASKLDEHDQKTDIAIATMTERTKPRRPKSQEED